VVGPDYANPMSRVLYSPICERPKIRWPYGARVAFWVSPNVEHYEYLPPSDEYLQFLNRVPSPDVQQYGFREYGNRVGFWRMVDVLDEYRIRATISLNLAVLDHFPEIRDAMMQRGWAYMSHGLYNTRPLYGCSEVEERAQLREAIKSLRRHTGLAMKGMLGPATSTTIRTFDLMAEAGLKYSADWYHDDQPAPILTTSGRLVSVPYSIELNDRNPALNCWLSTLVDRCIGQFDRLWREGEESGRVMCVALHPYVIGQPHMIDYLRRILDHVSEHDQVWYATADEISDYYLEHCYDEHLDHALAVQAKQNRARP
jgi:allantoinase